MTVDGVFIVPLSPKSATVPRDEGKSEEGGPRVGKVRRGRSEGGMDPLSAALKVHRAGRIEEARALYERVLNLRPDHPEARHLLGTALIALGRVDDGLRRIGEAVGLKPGDSAFHVSLIAGLARAARWDDAVVAARDMAAACAGAGNLPGTLLALANALYDAARRTEAVEIYEMARPVAQGAQVLEATYNRACCLRDLGAYENALAGFAEAQGIAPATMVVYDELAVLATVVAARRVRGGGDRRSALELCRLSLMAAPDAPAGWMNLASIAGAVAGASATAALRAVRLDPGSDEAWLNLGGARHGMRDRDGASFCHRRVVALAPASADGWRNLGVAALDGSRFDEALAFLDRGAITAAGASMAGIQSNRGVALMSSGRQMEAVAAFRAALATTPGDLTARSNLLFCLCFTAEVSPEEVFAEHRAFERHVPRRTVDSFLPARPVSSDDRIRIGYVSPDFQRYPGPGFHFLSPLIERHDRRRFAVTCYHCDTVVDDTTRAFRSAAENWRDVAGAGDDELARRVAADGIDILVDCGGHMSRTRIAAFVHRIAPVQVSFPLYPNTTGLSAMDYQFGDRWLTPPEMADFRTEALVRLPGSVLCYRPAESGFAPPARAPWEGRGVVTLASFNNLAKLDVATLDVWSTILREAPNARLRLKWRGLADRVAARILAAFSDRGVAADRLEMMGNTPDPYQAYGDVDLCLDPVFAAGGTTSCDALWMGVPVLTLPGRTAIGRWGLSLLSVVGLCECVATSVDDYVSRAVGFAREPAGLSRIREGLRERVRASLLMNEGAYAAAVEDAYARMWRRHLGGEAPLSFDVGFDGAAP